MGFHSDTGLNDGSFLIGMWGNPGNPHQSEVSVVGVNDWQGITGRMTAELVANVPGPTVGTGASSFAFGALFLGWLVRRRGNQMV